MIKQTLENEAIKPINNVFITSVLGRWGRQRAQYLQYQLLDSFQLTIFPENIAS